MSIFFLNLNSMWEGKECFVCISYDLPISCNKINSSGSSIREKVVKRQSNLPHTSPITKQWNMKINNIWKSDSWKSWSVKEFNGLKGIRIRNLKNIKHESKMLRSEQVWERGEKGLKFSERVKFKCILREVWSERIDEARAELIFSKNGYRSFEPFMKNSW